jgi:hypothetical protein
MEGEAEHADAEAHAFGSGANHGRKRCNPFSEADAFALLEVPDGESLVFTQASDVFGKSAGGDAKLIGDVGGGHPRAYTVVVFLLIVEHLNESRGTDLDAVSGTEDLECRGLFWHGWLMVVDG